LLPRVSSEEEEVVTFLSKRKKDSVLDILRRLISFIVSFCVCVCVCVCVRERERERERAQLSSAQLSLDQTNLDLEVCSENFFVARETN